MRRNLVRTILVSMGVGASLGAGIWMNHIKVEKNLDVVAEASETLFPTAFHYSEDSEYVEVRMNKPLMTTTDNDCFVPTECVYRTEGSSTFLCDNGEYLTVDGRCVIIP